MSGKGFDSPIALPVEVLASGQGPKDVIKSKISPVSVALNTGFMCVPLVAGL